jgi:hypothetical protein
VQPASKGLQVFCTCRVDIMARQGGLHMHIEGQGRQQAETCISSQCCACAVWVLLTQCLKSIHESSGSAPGLVL